MPARISLTAALVLVLASFALPATAGAADWPIVGWWPLNEGRGQTAYDWSGQGNHGQLGSTAGVDSNDPSWIRGRWFGSALSFGGDDFIRIPSSKALEPQQLTLSLWFRGTGSPGTYKYLVAKGWDACTAASYGIETSWNGGLWFYIWDAARHMQFGSDLADQSVWDGKWHHAAGTWDGVLAKLFIDGREIGEGSSSPGTIDYSLPEGEGTLGGYRGSCQLLFTGDLDDVKIWNKPPPVGDIWKRLSALLGSPTIQ
jgi:hypothetical protein